MAATPPPTTQSPTVFDGWRDYPTTLRSYDSITTPGAVLNRRITTRARRLFSKEINVRVIDIEAGTSGPKCSHRVYNEPLALENLVAEHTLPRIRIISIHQKRSISPLQITEELMRKLLSRYQVRPEFLPVLFSFGGEPHLAEAGSSNITCLETSNAPCHTSYQLRYAEENHRSPKTPWSVRQTGVYHQHDGKSKFDLWILLNPSGESVIESQLEELESPETASKAALARICDDAFRLHVLICTSYVDNWRWYLRYLGEQFEKRNDDALALNHNTAAAVSLSFDAVQNLRHLHDNVMSLSASCKGDLQIIQTLEDARMTTFEGLYSLKPFSTQLTGHIESLDVLQNRIRNVIDLLAYALDLRNQDNAAAINGHLLDLQETTVDDSSTVKLITIFSLIFLPGSFVGTLYGMNFFYFDPKARRIVIAGDFWIYLATWLPLTLVTIALYSLMRLNKKKESKEKEKRQEEQWRVQGSLGKEIAA